MNSTIYFVRHGSYIQSGDLLPFRRPDVHLSEEGIRESKKIADFFSHKPITAIYSSPMERTQETAKIIAGKRPVITDDRLTEVRSAASPGNEGIPDAISGWDKFNADWWVTRGGEKLEDIADRMESFVREKIRTHPGEEIIAVSHGDPIMVMVSIMEKKKPWGVPYVEIGEIRRLTFPAGWVK